jgi:hypothetical protein
MEDIRHGVAHDEGVDDAKAGLQDCRGGIEVATVGDGMTGGDDIMGGTGLINL